MYLLETVAVSEMSKPGARTGMMDFLSDQPLELLFISVISIGEMAYGWSRLPDGKRRAQLQEWLREVEDAFGVRALDVDPDVAREWGQLRAAVKKNGYNIDLPDLLIAATAIHHDLTVVTRNVRDFAPTGCKILNPWDDEN